MVHPSGFGILVRNAFLFPRRMWCKMHNFPRNCEQNWWSDFRDENAERVQLIVVPKTGNKQPQQQMALPKATAITQQECTALGRLHWENTYFKQKTETKDVVRMVKKMFNKEEAPPKKKSVKSAFGHLKTFFFAWCTRKWIHIHIGMYGKTEMKVEFWPKINSKE